MLVPKVHAHSSYFFIYVFFLIAIQDFQDAMTLPLQSSRMLLKKKVRSNAA